MQNTALITLLFLLSVHPASVAHSLPQPIVALPSAPSQTLDENERDIRNATDWKKFEAGMI